ncbi:MAG: fasciclin domain-containing protein [Verrucomicrobiota bacterium]
MKTTRFSILTTAVSLAIGSSLLAQEPAVDPQAAVTGATIGETAPAKDPIEPGSLSDTIRDSVTFAILAQALKASELDITLGQKGTFTIFAPTDEAFGKLPAGTVDKLLLPENKEKLRSLLLFHVVPGKVMAADLKEGQVKTMNGEKVEIEVDASEIEVGDTKVFSADVLATNGVMHSVGEVLVPKSLDGFAGLDE